MEADPYASMQVGVRVVRGLDWKWGHQDGGEGNVGTVVEIGRQGSPTTPDRTVVVQWDQGTRTNYRTGFQGAFDLLLYDNAQIGIRHPNIICDCCKKHGLRGMRWKCAVCFDYDLCTQCYMNNKHDLSHAFERYETALSRPVSVSPRQNLPRLPLRGIFQGAKVLRGPDWEWGNQDGGEGKIGRVVDIRGWDVETGRSVASVTWADGTTNVYRVGHKGKVDLKCVAEAPGGFYYKDHLPQLGKPAELRRRVSVDSQPFQHGDKVQCLLDIEILREMQEGHGGWNPKMAEFIGQTGTVHRITDRGDVRVQFNSETRWTFHPGALTTALGSSGKVAKVFGDGDLRMSLGGQAWKLSPSCLATRQREEDANLDAMESAKEPKSSLCAILEKLLAQKSDPDQPGRLVTEAAHGNIARLLELVKRHPDKVDVKNQGRTALQVASHLGQVESVRLLLQAHATVDTRDEEGDTALHYAAFGNQAEVARVLVSRGASVDLPNAARRTALHVAVSRGFADVVRVLCEHGCNVNLPDVNADTPLHCAISADAKGIIELLTEVPNVDFTVPNHQGFNLLHHAALKGNRLAVKKILARARQLVDAKKADGFSALHLAALNNHLEVAEILIKEGRCDVNIRTNRNQSPLHLAVIQGHLRLVPLLVSAGSSVNAEDEDGDTAMHMALERHQLLTLAAASDGAAAPQDRLSLLSKLQASGLLGNVELNVGVAIACFLAQEGADLGYTNHRGKCPLDLVTDGRTVQAVRSFAQRFREQQASLGNAGVSCNLRRAHSTPNTMTNLSVGPVAAGGAGLAECLVCSELALLVLFQPCQHSIVCEECSRRMKKCIKCQVTIAKKLKPDSSEVGGGPEAAGQRQLMEELQSRYRQMEERITCPICIDSHIRLVFQCGHGSCQECSASLSVCPICRQGIRDRIPIFV
ncbi:E3 ubiquitin-protein ligase MIB2 [Tachyglossus aculeatus]|uniref:E3 ubiquitin-protein ligase MIB2 n=1 Tax=Tachyglossus aculeatus TaxID=9261 RepID=UPI0018F2B623|nr:E3 ubiquitin-protein ligase MIB2 [Tachyglossus aculeatus]XP_038603317.1 E3 ubiquitin-protein ligase MIB2 [Tachyglossus aculeatus]XP_038603318.1 E3 ubiquitin-protein ligase MIB2 [Tachyglossus aculeatus]